MSEIKHPKALFDSSCGTNSESFALQNLGDMMSPEFSENCILIIDPGIKIQNKAYAIIEYKEELYFRQFIITKDKIKIMHCLNSSYKDIKLVEKYHIRGCVVQQKQRKQPTIHYYNLDKQKNEIIFIQQGFVKE